MVVDSGSSLGCRRHHGRREAERGPRAAFSVAYREKCEYRPADINGESRQACGGVRAAMGPQQRQSPSPGYGGE